MRLPESRLENSKRGKCFQHFSKQELEVVITVFQPVCSTTVPPLLIIGKQTNRTRVGILFTAQEKGRAQLVMILFLVYAQPAAATTPRH